MSQNRRQFLKQTAATTAAISLGAWASGTTRLLSEETSPNEKPNVASIGVGGKGSSDCDQAGEVGNMVALCDIDDNTLNGKGNKFPKAKKFNDFRVMLEEMGKSIDAVTVSTPDHTHAVAAMMAMKMGKHVYCQKPLTHTVYEARMMRETAAKYKVSTQMGNQGTAENGLRRGVEIIQAGIIGPVKEIHVWTNRPTGFWYQAPMLTERLPATECPAHVHWDLWLGPAPERPYVGTKMKNGNGPYHAFNWRGWLDFGTGALGDMACHTANMAFMACQLRLPIAVSAEHGPLNNETYPAWARITYEFPARGDMPPLKLFWYEGSNDQGKLLPSKELLRGKNPPGSGSLMVGEGGTLYSPNDYGAQYELIAGGNLKDYKDPPETLPRNGRGDLGMKEEWLTAARDGKQPMSNFQYASYLTESMLLGNVAIKAGKRIEYDGETMKIPNAPEAEQFLKTDYRKGWTL